MARFAAEKNHEYNRKNPHMGPLAAAAAAAVAAAAASAAAGGGTDLAYARCLNPLASGLPRT